MRVALSCCLVMTSADAYRQSRGYETPGCERKALRIGADMHGLTRLPGSFIAVVSVDVGWFSRYAG